MSISTCLCGHKDRLPTSEMRQTELELGSTRLRIWYMALRLCFSLKGRNGSLQAQPITSLSLHPSSRLAYHQSVVATTNIATIFATSTSHYPATVPLLPHHYAQTPRYSPFLEILQMKTPPCKKLCNTREWTWGIFTWREKRSATNAGIVSIWWLLSMLLFKGSRISSPWLW